MFYKFPILQYVTLLICLGYLTFKFKTLYATSEVIKQRKAIKRFYVPNDEMMVYENKYKFIPDSLPKQYSLTLVRDSIGIGRGTHHSFMQTAIIPIILYNKFKVNGLVPSKKMNDTILGYFPDTKTWFDPRNPLYPVRDSVKILKNFGNDIYILYKKNL